MCWNTANGMVDLKEDWLTKSSVITWMKWKLVSWLGPKSKVKKKYLKLAENIHFSINSDYFFYILIQSISFQTAMEMMGTVGVIVNCALIGLSGPVNRIFPNMTATQTILLIIVLEVPTTLYITKLGFQWTFKRVV